MPETREYSGSYFDEQGRHLTFRVEAVDFAAAEAAIERIGCSGRIDGEFHGEMVVPAGVYTGGRA